MDNKSPSLSREPLKTLFTLLFLVTTPLRLPFIFLLYAHPAGRPVRSWTWKAAVFNHMTRMMFCFQAKIEHKTTQSLKPGAEGENFQLIPPAPEDLLRGPLANSKIKPSTVGGVWLPHRLQRTDAASRVILHFHGGAFVLLSPRNSYAQYGPKLLCSMLPADAALSVQYRLASNVNGSFPAPVQDAVSAYAFLLNHEKVAPSRIVLSGDSSGAHIVIGLLRYLSEHDVLPPPHAALLSSPWVNLTKDGITTEGHPAAKTDYITTEFLAWGARKFTPDDTSLGNRYISPLHHPFTTSVPIWVQAGGSEFMLQDIKTWVHEMTSEADNRVKLVEQPKAMHSLLSIAEAVGMESVLREAIRDAQKFV